MLVQLAGLATRPLAVQPIRFLHNSLWCRLLPSAGWKLIVVPEKFFDTPKEIRVPFVPFPPAATRTMLPVVCELHREVVVVLPTTATPLTLVGPSASTTPAPEPPTQVVLVFLVSRSLEAIGILLTMNSGLREVPNEFTLWTWTSRPVFGRLESSATDMFTATFRSPRLMSTMGTLPTTLFPRAPVDFAKEDPAKPLHFAIIILLRPTALGRSIMPRRLPPGIPTNRAPTFRQVMIRTPLLGFILNAHPLLTLAIILRVLPFRMETAVLTSGLRLLVETINLSTACRRVKARRYIIYSSNKIKSSTSRTPMTPAPNLAEHPVKYMLKVVPPHPTPQKPDHKNAICDQEKERSRNPRIPAETTYSSHLVPPIA